ncbi:MAG: hypothetical protein ACYSO3_01095 [Planctomycetota bacterium]
MIEDNIATGDDTCSGAGFYVLDSSANIQDVVLTGNAADGWGGAIFFAGPPRFPVIFMPPHWSPTVRLQIMQ